MECFNQDEGERLEQVSLQKSSTDYNLRALQNDVCAAYIEKYN